MQAALGELARSFYRECGGRVVRTPNIHLTLVFLGDVPTARFADLMTLAGSIAATAFEFAIDTCGYWRHNRIVWAGTARCPQPLCELVLQLIRALRAAGFQCDERDYVPHITLLRAARRAPAPQAAAQIPWRAADFALVQSVRRDGGVAYDVVQRWPLMPMV